MKGQSSELQLRRWGAARTHAAIGAARQAEALRLRLEGKTCAAIGQALGISEKNAAKHVRNALRVRSDYAELLRVLEDARLDRLLEAVWPGVEEGDIHAVVVALGISKRRAALWGLDGGRGASSPQLESQTMTLHRLRSLAAQEATTPMYVAEWGSPPAIGTPVRGQRSA
jgi:hypothetical protein